jgi:P-type E1-E2 ATPase
MATALGTAARQGLLVRDASAMERLACLTDLALDKTGTLTDGRPSLQQVLPTSNLDAAALLRLAAGLERGSEHPIAKGILAAAGPSTVDVQSFQAHPGGGVSGVAEDRRLRLGGAGFLGVTLPDVAPEWANATLVGLAEDQRLLGVFVLTDAMKSDTPALVASLKTRHLHLHLLSGDRPEAVRALALRLGIEDALGGCSPDTKRDRIAALQAQGRVVAFLGDGVNDALALAQADAGIALPGLEAAQASAPLNLLREGLAPLVSTLDLARRTRVVIRQNLAWAFGYNLLLVPLAAFNQLDRFGGPMLAGAAMGLSSLTVVLNALRLRRSA